MADARHVTLFKHKKRHFRKAKMKHSRSFGLASRSVGTSDDLPSRIHALGF